MDVTASKKNFKDDESPTRKDDKKTMGDSPMKKEKAKPPKKPKVVGDGFQGGLSKDFESFDILWFDIATKSRQLVSELCQPVVDRVHHHEDQIGQIFKTQDKECTKLLNLENTVYDKDKKIDIFD